MTGSRCRRGTRETRTAAMLQGRPNMNTARTLLLILALGLPAQVALTPGVARAQDGPAAGQGEAGAEAELSPREAKRRARALEREFQRLFQDEQLDEAIAVLEEIVRLDPQDLHIYNLGLIHYHRGDKEKSLAAFQRFLGAKPRDRSLVREAQRFVRILERDVQIIREARRQAESQAAEAERQAATARAEAEQARVQLQAEREARAQAEAERDRWRRAAASGAGDAGGFKRTLGVSLALAGGLALGAGAFYGIDAMNANSEAESVTQWTVGHDWLIQRAESYEQRALIFSLAGAGLVAAGATLYYLGEREAREPRSEGLDIDVAPAVTPDGPGVSIQGRF